MGLSPRALARLIDHTLLRPDATRAQIESLCDEAIDHGFAAICVNPCWVSLTAARLAAAESWVCTVVGFPLGASAPETKAEEAARAVGAGAAEVDMVLNIGALKSDDEAWVTLDIAGVIRACHPAGARVKVILETALLTDAEKRRVCLIARDAGADFVKTSTGFGSGGATLADVALLRHAVGPAMGVKAAGGIRDLPAALAMIDAGASRIGSSASVAIVTAAEQALADARGR